MVVRCYHCQVGLKVEMSWTRARQLHEGGFTDCEDCSYEATCPHWSVW